MQLRRSDTILFFKITCGPLDASEIQTPDFLTFRLVDWKFELEASRGAWLSPSCICCAACRNVSGCAFVILAVELAELAL